MGAGGHGALHGWYVLASVSILTGLKVLRVAVETQESCAACFGKRGGGGFPSEEGFRLGVSCKWVVTDLG